MYVHHAGRLYGEGLVAATSSGVINRGGLVEPGLPDHTFDVPDVLTNDLDETIGTLSIQGDYTQEVYDDGGTDRIGTLRIKISGSQADKLSVDGNISLVANGAVKPRLEIVAVGTVTPFRDFDILDWTGSFSGDFEIVLPAETTTQWILDDLYTTGVIRSQATGTTIQVQ